MRVFECNYCGETLAGANDDELRAALMRHMQSDHPDVEFDDEGAAELVEQQAYAASDS
jgi:predicted small metal-binding protein